MRTHAPVLLYQVASLALGLCIDAGFFTIHSGLTAFLRTIEDGVQPLFFALHVFVDLIGIRARLHHCRKT